MGYTKFTKELVQKVLDNNKIESVVDLGACNDYEIGGSKPPYISEWYSGKGIFYKCIDLGGDNQAIPLDLAYQFEVFHPYDLVVDAGTSEHVVKMGSYETVAFHEGHIHSIYPIEVENIDEGYYNCWVNKHNLLKVGGVMVNENPLTNNWRGHGYSYLGGAFYHDLKKYSHYEIIELGTHASMGNSVDGWNIYAVLVKRSERFPTFEEFKTFNILPS
jgi:hypothetical protein